MVALPFVRELVMLIRSYLELELQHFWAFDAAVDLDRSLNAHEAIMDYLQLYFGFASVLPATLHSIAVTFGDVVTLQLIAVTFGAKLAEMVHDIVWHSFVYWQAFVCKQFALVYFVVEHHTDDGAFAFAVAIFLVFFC